LDTVRNDYYGLSESVCSWGENQLIFVFGIREILHGRLVFSRLPNRCADKDRIKKKDVRPLGYGVVKVISGKIRVLKSSEKP
jgi:hypothetical protein